MWSGICCINNHTESSFIQHDKLFQHKEGHWGWGEISSSDLLQTSILEEVQKLRRNYYPKLWAHSSNKNLWLALFFQICYQFHTSIYRLIPHDTFYIRPPPKKHYFFAQIVPMLPLRTSGSDVEPVHSAIFYLRGSILLASQHTWWSNTF